MDPINYGIGAGRPVTAEDFLTGAKVGQAIGLGQQQAQSADLARTQAVSAQQQHAAMMAEFAAEADREGGPATDGIARLMVKYPSAAENLKKSHDAMQPAEKREREAQLIQTTSAINMGKPQIAIDGLKQKADAYRRGGRETDAVALEKVAELIEADPKRAQFTLNAQAAAWLGEGYQKAMAGLEGMPDTLREGAAKATKEEAEAAIKQEELKGLPAKMAAELGLTKAQATGIYMRAQVDKEMLGIEWAKLAEQRAKNTADLQQKAGELPPAVFKSVDEAYGKAQVATATAEQAANLAKEFLAADPASGWAGSMAEGWKNFQGQEDQVSALKGRYEVIKNSAILGMLPPGPATDRDIQLFSKGFPGSNAAPEAVAGFLRGMAKTANLAAAAGTAEAEWMGYNKSKAPARAPMVIQGVQVAPGTTYGQFQAEVLKRAAGNQAAAGVPAATSMNSKYGAPGG